MHKETSMSWLAQNWVSVVIGAAMPAAAVEAGL